MPDANLPSVVIDPVRVLHPLLAALFRSHRNGSPQDYLLRLKRDLPELGHQTLERLPPDYEISRTDAETLLLMDDIDGTGVEYFEEVARLVRKGVKGKKVVNWIVNELLGQLTARAETWTEDTVPAAVLAQLIDLVESGEMTGEFEGMNPKGRVESCTLKCDWTIGTSGKTLLRHLLDHPQPASADIWSLVESLKLASTGDDSLQAACEAVMVKLPTEAESVRRGNDKVVMRLVGQVMKDTSGRADAKKATEILLGMLRDGS